MIIGSIDNLIGGFLQGWVYDPSMPDQSAEFFIGLGSTVIGKGVANQYRADLAEEGMADGHCSFSVPLNLPPSRVTQQAFYLLDSHGNKIPGTDFKVEDQLPSYQVFLLDTHNYRFVFEVLCEHSVETGVTLYAGPDSEFKIEQHISLVKGINTVSFQLSPSLINQRSFKLAVNDAPAFLWQQHLTLPPLFADDTQLLYEPKLQGLALNRYKLLMQNMEEMDGDKDQLKSLSEDYFVTTASLTASGSLANQEKELVSAVKPSRRSGLLSSLMSFRASYNNDRDFVLRQSEVHPEISVVLPPLASPQLVMKMCAAIKLTGVEHFEVIWPTNERVETEGLLNSDRYRIIQINDIQDSSAADYFSAIWKSASSGNIIFCPVEMEFCKDYFNFLIRPLSDSCISYSIGKLSTHFGTLIDAGFSQNSDAVLPGLMDVHHPSISFNRIVAITSKSCVVFSKQKVSQYIQLITETTFERALIQLQSLLVNNSEFGVRVANSVSYANGDKESYTGALNDIIPWLETENFAQQTVLPSEPIQTSPYLCLKGGAFCKGTVFMLDMHVPTPDQDAGSYAAIQEIRLIQSLGFHVVFVPMSFAHNGKYTEQLQSMGVEVCYGPYYSSISELICQKLPDACAVYITRYNVATQYIDLIKAQFPELPIIFNNADLHFLREMRAALYTRDEGALQKALATRETELGVMEKVDAILSYNEVEHAVIASHLLTQDKIFKCPWVLETKEPGPGFRDRHGIAFLGGYNHPPNVEAVYYFINEIMPELIKVIPDIQLYIYGSNMPVEFELLATKNVVLVGFVDNLDDVFNQHRVFISPLLSGAGIKGKVLESAAYGLPSVLSSIAVESTGLSHNISTLVADTCEQWVDSIQTLYNDEQTWLRVSENQRILAKEYYSDSKGRELMANVFSHVGLID